MWKHRKDEEFLHAETSNIYERMAWTLFSCIWYLSSVLACYLLLQRFNGTWLENQALISFYQFSVRVKLKPLLSCLPVILTGQLLLERSLNQRVQKWITLLKCFGWFLRDASGIYWTEMDSSCLPAQTIIYSISRMNYKQVLTTTHVENDHWQHINNTEVPGENKLKYSHQVLQMKAPKPLDQYHRKTHWNPGF